jgi:hypothetical protein
MNLFAVVFVLTVLVHLGKFVDWLIGSKQDRIKRDLLTELYAFFESGGLRTLVATCVHLVHLFFNWLFDHRIFSAKWLVRAALYSIVLNVLFGMAYFTYQGGAFLDRWQDVRYLVQFAASLSVGTLLLFFVDLPILAIFHSMIRRVDQQPAVMANLRTYMAVSVIACLWVLNVAPFLQFFVMFVFYTLGMFGLGYYGPRLVDDIAEFLIIAWLGVRASAPIMCVPFAWVYAQLGLDFPYCTNGTRMVVFNEGIAELGPFWRTIYPGAAVFAIPPVMPIVLTAVVVSMSALLRVSSNSLRPVLVFILERMQANSSGVFTQIALGIAGVTAILAMFR